jgi:ApaG protein
MQRETQTDRLKTYAEVTHSIRVTVYPMYVEEHSSPTDHKYFWAYHIRIENQGERTVQLRNRHWRITDAKGRTEEVKGPGVVGKEPVLSPGEAFEYTSGVPLQTPSGFMVGTYEMEGESGDRFQVAIPAFSLDSPHQPRQLN